MFRQPLQVLFKAYFFLFFWLELLDFAASIWIFDVEI